jgi:hypothetical protein
VSLNLTATNHALEVVTTQALATDVVVSYRDLSATGVTPGSQQTAITTATTTTVASAPGSSVQRLIEDVEIVNKGSGSQSVTAQKDVGGTNFVVFGPIAIAQNERVHFTSDNGWRVFNAQGQERSTMLTDGDYGDIVVSGAGTVLTVDNGVISPSNLAAVAGNSGAAFCLHVPLTATGGPADDVTIFVANAPFAFRILDVWVLVSTLQLLSNVTLRSATGGGGSALSSALQTTLTGTVRNNDTVTRTVTQGGSLYARRTTGSIVGELVILGVRI